MVTENTFSDDLSFKPLSRGLSVQTLFEEFR